MAFDHVIIAECWEDWNLTVIQWVAWVVADVKLSFLQRHSIETNSLVGCVLAERCLEVDLGAHERRHVNLGNKVHA